MAENSSLAANADEAEQVHAAADLANLDESTARTTNGAQDLPLRPLSNGGTPKVNHDAAVTFEEPVVPSRSPENHEGEADQEDQDHGVATSVPPTEEKKKKKKKKSRSAGKRGLVRAFIQNRNVQGCIC